jgi:hypothetical protein
MKLTDYEREAVREFLAILLMAGGSVSAGRQNPPDILDEYLDHTRYTDVDKFDLSRDSGFIEDVDGGEDADGDAVTLIQITQAGRDFVQQEV